MSKNKNLKFYIPVIGISRLAGVTMINANKIPSIKDLYPSGDIINQHLTMENQRRKIEENYQFHSIKVGIKPEKYQILIQQQRHLMKHAMNTQTLVVF